MSRNVRTLAALTAVVVAALLGALVNNAYRAGRDTGVIPPDPDPLQEASVQHDERARKEATDALEAIVVRANLTTVAGGRVAHVPRQNSGQRIPAPLGGQGPSGSRESLYRNGQYGIGYVRTLFTAFDWADVKAEPELGGVPARMMELAAMHQQILAEGDFVLVAADGWSSGGGVYPQVRVRRNVRYPTGGGHGGYTLLVHARHVVHVRVYAGRNHAASVVVRQQYESQHSLLTVEMFFLDPGAAPQEVTRLEIWETPSVITE